MAGGARLLVVGEAPLADPSVVHGASLADGSRRWAM
jgi:hypothetical protein